MSNAFSNKTFLPFKIHYFLYRGYTCSNTCYFLICVETDIRYSLSLLTVRSNREVCECFCYETTFYQQFKKTQIIGFRDKTVGNTVLACVSSV
jgi:hypothetical protein